MHKKEPLICQNIRKLKKEKKEFSHFGDYLITFATLSGLFANLCTNYIPYGFEKTVYMVTIALILEVMYIIAISLKISSHYSIKEYVKEYQQEKLRQKKALTVTSNREKLNRRINLSIAKQKKKRYQKNVIWVGLSVAPLVIVIYLIYVNKISELMIFAILLLIVCIIFPLLSILAWKELCRYYLIIFAEKSKNVNQRILF